MKIQKSIQHLFKNEAVLYLVSIIAISNIIFYLYNHQIEELVIFSVLGYITSLYTKNMAIILAVATICTNLLSSYNNYYRKLKQKKTIEGMENKNKKKNNKKDQEHEDQDLKEIEDDDEDEDEIDIINTQKESFADLSKSLQEGGLQNLTKETMSLINQQKELMDTFKDMGPLMKSAQDVMKGMNSLDLKGGLGNLTSMSEGLSKMMGGRK